MKISKSLQSALENIYISPLEKCNLSCKYCYTNKTKENLSNQKILDFIEKYSSYLRKKNYELKSILFCGGEVFTLPKFTDLINNLIEKNIFITIITNGTVDKLKKIKNPKNCQLLVSFDGPKEIHDLNRGKGNFNKSLKFVKHALKLNFPVEIMFLITKDSYYYKDTFNVLNLQKTYLSDRNMSLSINQLLDIKKNYKSYPNKNFGCFQLSIQSNGNITSCCESSKSIGFITNNPKNYINNFINSLLPCFKCKKCNGCGHQDFFCNYPKELKLNSCKEVLKSFK